MKRLVIFVVLLVVIMPISFAKEVSILELFDVAKESVSISYGKEVYFYAGSKLIAVNNEYQYQDRLGSEIKSKSLPFGQVLNLSNRFSFTGKELDSDLYYFNARYYDSNLGKFTSIDPVKENNAYAYVENSPMNYIDPSGADLKFHTEGFLPENDALGAPTVKNNLLWSRQTITNRLVNRVNDVFGENLFYLDESNYLQANENINSYSGNSNQKLLLDRVMEMINHPGTINIFFKQNSDFASKTSGAVFLSPEYQKKGYSDLGKNRGLIRYDPVITFFHETDHALFALNYGDDLEKLMILGGPPEATAVKMGNVVRSVMGLEPRYYYGAQLYPEQGSSFYFTPESYDSARENGYIPEFNMDMQELLGKSDFYGDVYLPPIESSNLGFSIRGN